MILTLLWWKLSRVFLSKLTNIFKKVFPVICDLWSAITAHLPITFKSAFISRRDLPINHKSRKNERRSWTPITRSRSLILWSVSYKRASMVYSLEFWVILYPSFTKCPLKSFVYSNEMRVYLIFNKLANRYVLIFIVYLEFCNNFMNKMNIWLLKTFKELDCIWYSQTRIDVD